MMEKIKLTREQAEAVRSAIKNYTFEEIMENHMAVWHAPTRRCLNGIKTEDMARALLIGYEVEETYKVGDWVFNKSSDSVIEIVAVEYANMLNGENCNVRHATPEEIKNEQERRVWRTIGRKVGEFRYGDVCVSDNQNEYWLLVDNMERMYRKGKVKGFYPEESFIKFGGADE